MPNVKAQSSNESRSSNDKTFYEEELLTLKPFGIHLAFGFWHLEFG